MKIGEINSKNFLNQALLTDAGNVLSKRVTSSYLAAKKVIEQSPLSRLKLPDMPHFVVSSPINSVLISIVPRLRDRSMPELPVILFDRLEGSMSLAEIVKSRPRRREETIFTRALNQVNNNNEAISLREFDPRRITYAAHLLQALINLSMEDSNG